MVMSRERIRLKLHILCRIFLEQFFDGTEIIDISKKLTQRLTKIIVYISGRKKKTFILKLKGTLSCQTRYSVGAFDKNFMADQIIVSIEGLSTHSLQVRK